MACPLRLCDCLIAIWGVSGHLMDHLLTYPTRHMSIPNGLPEKKTLGGHPNFHMFGGMDFRCLMYFYLIDYLVDSRPGDMLSLGGKLGRHDVRFPKMFAAIWVFMCYVPNLAESVRFHHFLGCMPSKTPNANQGLMCWGFGWAILINILFSVALFSFRFPFLWFYKKNNRLNRN